MCSICAIYVLHIELPAKLEYRCVCEFSTYRNRPVALLEALWKLTYASIRANRASSKATRRFVYVKNSDIHLYSSFAGSSMCSTYIAQMENIELPAKLLDYFLRCSKSNIKYT